MTLTPTILSIHARFLYRSFLNGHVQEDAPGTSHDPSDLTLKLGKLKPETFSAKPATLITFRHRARCAGTKVLWAYKTQAQILNSGTFSPEAQPSQCP